MGDHRFLGEVAERQCDRAFDALVDAFSLSWSGTPSGVRAREDAVKKFETKLDAIHDSVNAVGAVLRRRDLEERAKEPAKEPEPVEPDAEQSSARGRGGRREAKEDKQDA